MPQTPNCLRNLIREYLQRKTFFSLFSYWKKYTNYNAKKVFEKFEKLCKWISMINTDTKIKAWNNLPQEFRDEIRELYKKVCNNERVHQNSEPRDKVCLGIAMGKKQLLEHLFGFSVNNFTLYEKIVIK